MKIYPSNISNFIQKTQKVDTIFLLYGNNFGLIDQTYENIVDSLNINLHDPFSTIKIDYSQLIDNKNLLSEELSTFSLLKACKNVILDIRAISTNESILEILQNSFIDQFTNYRLIILAGQLKSNSLYIKFVESLNNNVIIPCYEEDSKILKNKLKNYLIKHNISLTDDELSKTLLKLSKDTKLNQNVFNKLDIVSLSETLNVKYFGDSFDDNLNTDINMLVNYSLCGDFIKASNILNKSKLSKISSIAICRKFISQLKIVDKILSLVNKGFSFDSAVSKSNYVIFFKDKEYLFTQSRIWRRKSIQEILKKLFDTEINCKLYSDLDYSFLENTMMFIHLKANKKSINP